MNPLKPLVIVCAGGFGREVACIVADINQQKPEWNFLGFVDDTLSGFTKEGYPILGPISSLSSIYPHPWVAIAIGDPRMRSTITNKCINYGNRLATIIHPSAIIQNAVIGEGCIICSRTIITTNVKLGNACILNLGTLIGHDTVLGDFSSLMPAVNLAGEVVIGNGCYLGLNSCVINRKIIGEWSIVGAGATVLDDIPPYSVAVGVPAKVIKKTPEITQKRD